MNKKLALIFIFVLLSSYFAYSYVIKPTSTTSIKVFGTEYQVNDNATIFLQLLTDGQPQNNASCLLTVFYPDKTIFLDEVLMFYKEGSDGLYYFDFITPDKTGVYMVSVKCFYVINYNYDYADASTVTYGLESGTYQDTWKDDNVFHSITEKIVGGYRMEIEYDFYNVTIPNNATSVGINWVGKWNDPSESIFVAIYNYCNMTWENCSTQITTNTPMYSCMLEGNVSCYINDSIARVSFRDYDPTEKEEAGVFDTDFLEFKTLYLTYGQINNIRGSGEVHVTKRIIDQIGDEGANVVVVS